MNRNDTVYLKTQTLVIANALDVIKGKSCLSDLDVEILNEARYQLETYHELLFKSFKNKETLPALYEAWYRLPACELMGVIGSAMQDIQASEGRTVPDKIT